MTNNLNIQPKEITEDYEFSQSIGHFSYYEGLQLAKENNLKQTISYQDILNKPCFLVSCGDILMVIDKNLFKIETKHNSISTNNYDITKEE
jgi:hypothetical protein